MCLQENGSSERAWLDAKCYCATMMGFTWCMVPPAVPVTAFYSSGRMKRAILDAAKALQQKATSADQGVARQGSVQGGSVSPR